MSSAWLVPRGHTRIAVEGELDFDSVVPLLAQSRRLFGGQGRIEVDLGGVRRANSAGLALLLEWLDLAQQQGAHLRFHNPPELLLRLAAVTNVGELLPVVRGRG
jgi:phospholipid transport system transporter-binding protein